MFRGEKNCLFNFSYSEHDKIWLKPKCCQDMFQIDCVNILLGMLVLSQSVTIDSFQKTVYVSILPETRDVKAQE